MKKSKIIVPALGLLVLSTAASVSGTVAWFTANRSWNTTISSFAVVSTTGSLKGSFVGGVGTAANSEATALSIETGAKLTHGSFDHSDKYASWPTEDTASQFDEYLVTGTKATDAHETNKSLYRTTDTSGNKIYTAFTWELTLTYTTTNTTDSYALFLDNAKSIVERKTTGTAEKQTYKGFRLAFIGLDTGTSASSEKLVWADNQVAEKCEYVSSVNATTHAATSSSYAAGDLLASDTSSNIAALAGTGEVVDGVAAATAQSYVNYLGTFAPASGVAARTMKFLCVAWYEGTDENVVTEADLDTVDVKMFFETRKVA